MSSLNYPPVARMNATRTTPPYHPVQVEEEQIYAIPEAVRSSRNQYMDRMAALDAEEEKGKLAFIVVPSLLIPRPVL